MPAAIILFSRKAIALLKTEVSRLRAASAASIVAAKDRSFRLTRSAFSLSPLATKASLPKGLSDHCRSAFDFRLRRTRHWRAVALWKPSGPSPCCYTLNVAQDHSSFIRSYIMMPAATAALRDSAPPRMGSLSRWVASAFTPSDTPFPSLPITRQKRSPTSPRR